MTRGFHDRVSNKRDSELKIKGLSELLVGLSFGLPDFHSAKEDCNLGAYVTERQREQQLSEHEKSTKVATHDSVTGWRRSDELRAELNQEFRRWQCGRRLAEMIGGKDPVIKDHRNQKSDRIRSPFPSADKRHDGRDKYGGCRQDQERDGKDAPSFERSKANGRKSKE